MSNKEKMLHDIGVVDFAVVELQLYLDTHPHDRNAIEYFNHYNRMKVQMEKEFSKNFFPLKTEYADSNQDWRWGMAPLPWEGVCD